MNTSEEIVVGSAMPPPNAPEPGPLLRLLRDLPQRLPDEAVSVRAVLDAFGRQAIGFTLFLFTVPAVVPSPGLPLGAVFGAVVALLAFQMTTNRERFTLPAWLLRRELPRRAILSMLSRVEPRVAWLERRLRPGRMPGLLTREAERWLALPIALCAIAIALPIPFGNAIPALAICVIALGLMSHDGAAVAMGLAIAVAAMATSVALVWGAVVILGWV